MRVWFADLGVRKGNKSSAGVESGVWEQFRRIWSRRWRTQSRRSGELGFRLWACLTVSFAKLPLPPIFVSRHPSSLDGVALLRQSTTLPSSPLWSATSGSSSREIPVPTRWDPPPILISLNCPNQWIPSLCYFQILWSEIMESFGMFEKPLWWVRFYMLCLIT